MHGNAILAPAPSVDTPTSHCCRNSFTVLYTGLALCTWRGQTSSQSHSLFREVSTTVLSLDPSPVQPRSLTPFDMYPAHSIVELAVQPTLGAFVGWKRLQSNTGTTDCTPCAGAAHNCT
eukprot:GHUV01028197.1.p2 GENE.GHUV01028197.1~~GHUV01028197.1.p2  ORF type:complete len:119 (+),score=7.03 GHUV01028197.1:691-1047(+)